MSATGGLPDLLERQRALEDHMLGLGGERFRRKVQRAVEHREASTAGAGVKLLRHAVDPVERGITALLEATNKRGPKHQALHWLQQVGAETAAFITARVIIDGIHAVIPLWKTATSISTTLLDELRYRRLERLRPALFQYKLANLPGTNYDHNKKVLDQTIRYAMEHPRDGDEALDLSDLQMTDQQKLLVGSKLIDVFVTTTGLVEVVSTAAMRKLGKRSRHRKELYLRATPATKQWLAERDAVLEFLTPVNLPTIIPPRPWTREQRGGYHFALRNKYPLVRGVSPQHQQTVKLAEMPLVYEAVNAIQETGWRINPHVHQLVQQILDSGRSVAGIVASDPEPLPAKPVDIATNEEARRRWRKAARAVYERNHARTIRALEVTKVMLAASRVKDEERIYFPCNVDFRGRIYPLTNYLNPQGDDLSKALLTFADAKPLGPDGAYWLAIHGANCLDQTPEGLKVKTMTMEERAKWIQQNTKRIVRVADDPFGDLWWTDADEPLQFYAFCVEWRGFYAAHRKGEGEAYVCGLPVSQDGSCNGLQHFSAMLRDPVGGAAVNLMPLDKPQDVYEAVTKSVLAEVTRDAASGNWLAQQWLATGLVKRKLCKRPTMTFCYGSKRFGMAQQTLEFLQEDKAEFQRIRALFTDEQGENRITEATQYMAGLIWRALGNTVVAAAAAMKWMQDCARSITTQSRKPVQWTVPATGFPVRQEYFVTHFKQIKTVLAGQVIKPSVLQHTDELLLHKQANAVAPNIVHSLDAAALMMTVAQAAARGVTSFGMIHDSYATVPADCSALAEETRKAFVTLYRDHDVISHLHYGFLQQLPPEAEKPLPDMPPMGGLNIEGVLDSTYFFS